MALLTDCSCDVALTLQAGKELHRGPGFQAVIPDQVGTPSPQLKAWRGEPQRVSFEDAKALAHASELAAAEALPADAIWEFDEPDTRGGRARAAGFVSARDMQGRPRQMLS